jgi:hypothetical protein
MIRHFTAAAVAAIALSISPASAGVYTDDLTKCVVKSSDDNDQLALVQWIFSAISRNPAVEPLATITPEQRQTFDRKAAALVQRLLFENCRNEAIAALKYEGPSTMAAAFQVLGQVAARGLMSEPHAAQGLKSLGNYLDKEKTSELFRAAGIQVNPAGAETPAK